MQVRHAPSCYDNRKGLDPQRWRSAAVLQCRFPNEEPAFVRHLEVGNLRVLVQLPHACAACCCVRALNTLDHLCVVDAGNLVQGPIEAQKGMAFSSLRSCTGAWLVKCEDKNLGLAVACWAVLTPPLHGRS